jgi:hypothetical protein
MNMLTRLAYIVSELIARGIPSSVEMPECIMIPVSDSITLFAGFDNDTLEINVMDYDECIEVIDSTITLSSDNYSIANHIACTYYEACEIRDSNAIQLPTVGNTLAVHLL